MIVFNNRDRPNYDQIVDMAPKWLNEYREMNANNQFAGWTLDLMAYFLDMLVLNEFPKYCDEQHLRIYEKIFGVEYEEKESIEERRRTVLAYWSGIGKINKTAIINMVSLYTGADADVSWNNEILYIDFDGTSIRFSLITMLQKMLRRRIPAHIAYDLRCLCSISPDVACVATYPFGIYSPQIITEGFTEARSVSQKQNNAVAVYCGAVLPVIKETS